MWRLLSSGEPPGQAFSGACTCIGKGGGPTMRQPFQPVPRLVDSPRGPRPMSLQFGDFELDQEQRQLLRAGQAVPLEPKAYELLCLLVERRPRALSRAQIRDVVWPDTFISESTLGVVVNGLSQVFSTLAPRGDCGVIGRACRVSRPEGRHRRPSRRRRSSLSRAFSARNKTLPSRLTAGRSSATGRTPPSRTSSSRTAARTAGAPTAECSAGWSRCRSTARSRGWRCRC